MAYLPLFHKVINQPVLIIGGGKVAYRRVKLLLEAGANVELVSIELLPELEQLLIINECKYTKRAVREDDVKAIYMFIIAATNDFDVNESIHAWSKALYVPVNVVTNQKLCDFIFPGIINRDPMKIAISNSGQSPVLTKLLKEQLDQYLPRDYGDLSEFIGEYREKVSQKFPSPKKRAEFWKAVINGTVGEAFSSGRQDEAKWLLEQAINNSEEFLSTGEVYLIGAGPGDANLLTLRAFRLIQQADVVVYDRLVSDSVLELVKPTAEKIYVGKKRDQHSMQQEDISQLLVNLAKQGKRVARLKGGDPFIFGRGGEEIEILVEHEIFFQIVPGVTAANACSCYAGIPLTHRDYAQSVQFITGQLKNGTVDLNWSELIQEGKTLVFYMSLSTIPLIAKKLIEHGMNNDMEIGIIEKGTYKEQRVVTTTLAKVEQTIEQKSLVSPSLCIVGRVVKLADKLSWVK